MKIIADQQIPLISDLFADWGEVITLAGDAIIPSVVKDADILLVRTVTAVNQKLLENSSIQFVGSVSAGYDHLDCAWLESANITWGYAPGSNAMAVADYVLACIACLLKEKKIKPPLRIGIVGVGHVGSELASRLKKLGFQVLLNDPPRAKADSGFLSMDLDELISEVDILSLHTPLTYAGNYPTLHLINAHRLQALKKNAVLINTARAAVVDTQALELKQITTCLDVWENEPDINEALFRKATIATPHIAGYSAASKIRAIFTIYEKACQRFNQPNKLNSFKNYLNIKTRRVTFDSRELWENIFLQHYNPYKDSQAFLTAFNSAANKKTSFKIFREHYSQRLESDIRFT